MKKITVFGGSGFIGSNLIASLNSTSAYQVTYFSRSINPCLEGMKNVQHVQGDFVNEKLIRQALVDCDIAIHLISGSVPSTAEKNPVQDVLQGVGNTIKFMRELERAGVPELIYFSSGGAVYGNPIYEPVDENHPLRPVNVYGLNKVHAEQYIEYYSMLYDINFSIIRPSNPYGKGQRYDGLQGVISSMLFNILSENVISVWGDGSAVRDYIYIDDMSSLLVRMIENGSSGTYNVSAGMSYSVNELLKIAEKVTDLKARVSYVGDKKFSVDKVVLDSTRVRTQFDWAPEINIEEGMSKQVEWLSTLL